MVLVVQGKMFQSWMHILRLLCLPSVLVFHNLADLEAQAVLGVLVSNLLDVQEDLVVPVGQVGQKLLRPQQNQTAFQFCFQTFSLIFLLLPALP